jgi:hypothetical protein
MNAIHLYREGDHAIVAVEIEGKWVPVIREFIDSPFSHIVEPAGMQRCISRSLNENGGTSSRKYG